MSVDRVLNEFQIRSRDEIGRLVEGFGCGIRFVVAGEKETYLLGTIDRPDVNIWIYEDELELKAGDVHLLLEFPDFDSQDDMLYFFINGLRDYLLKDN